MTLFSTLLKQLSIKDFFDMGIVALMIYQVLKIVKGTRAIQVLLGMVFLAILYTLGIKYNLYTVNWILEHFFDYIFIIFIVIFQDQLRAALATVGTGRKMFNFFDRSPVNYDIEEVIKSVTALSKERTGALLVIERKNGLQNYIDTGTIIDATIHSDLIYSIFQTISPLHDGAIILRDGKLLAAGCFLPLSKNIEIDRHFGTRHRAALGVSEVSDAIVIIVSEETGKIKLCINGQFFYSHNENELRMMLKKAWAGKRLDLQSQIVGQV
ncbi:diadenylate cyclase CdaA [Halobacteriovorax sp. XZX-3]|uniref:diadenylate cyclase CdaA n=1 Tax=unclassified Halobacteriovorax TaxID=2639665 RepID=UPI000CD1AE20|nr:diadenylate cyclase CdaA [Halobacteriovorax sp. DA5]POB14281.1 TIGR00159 family protein [Halobacteriovorax sp. DA5]